MGVVDSVLRQHRWELDERRRFLAELESLALRLRRDAQRLHQEIEEESGAGRLLRQNKERESSTAGRPQGIAPTMDDGVDKLRSIVGAMACPRQ